MLKALQSIFFLIEESYKHCSYYSQLKSILEQLFEQEDEVLSDIALKSVMIICKSLNINTNFLKSSEIETHESMGQSKIISLCNSVGATSYLNLPSGIDLYQAAAFKQAHLISIFIN